jgi:hypothetical protein
VTDVVSVSDPAGPEDERLAELRSSARGWHGIQLAVIGFVGLCGVLKGSDSGAPDWVQALAGYLALAALAVACLATYLVGRAAWPLYDVRRAVPPVHAELLRTSRRITTGLVLTFTAVALVALAGLSSWWPADDAPDAAAGGAEVRVSAGGTSICGTLAAAQPGAVGVTVDGRDVAVRLDQLTSLEPVSGC